MPILHRKDTFTINICIFQKKTRIFKKNVTIEQYYVTTKCSKNDTKLCQKLDANKLKTILNKHFLKLQFIHPYWIDWYIENSL